MPFDLIQPVDNSDTGGLGPIDASSKRAQDRAASEWLEFCKVAKFKIGGKARIGGRTVEITSLRPLTGGMIAVKGHYHGGIINGNYRPGDLEVVNGY